LAALAGGAAYRTFSPHLKHFTIADGKGDFFGNVKEHQKFFFLRGVPRPRPPFSWGTESTIAQNCRQNQNFPEVDQITPNDGKRGQGGRPRNRKILLRLMAYKATLIYQIFAIILVDSLLIKR
jgi:hypothetical protein